jgi:uncharacterized protein YjbI with pentapeptide repeats
VKIFNPAQTEITFRVFSLAPKKYSMSVALLVRFNLHPDGEPSPDSKSPVWDVLKPAMKGYSTYDEGWPKLLGEYIVFGAAYLPSMQTLQPISAVVSIGDLSKQLAVFGDRHFNVAGLPTNPITFERMPISPQTAFGGESDQTNPYGKGADVKKEASGELLRLLPNVELPNAPMTSPFTKTAVAGFWPFYADMPQRTQYLGKFDENWVKTRWPHLPVNTDFSFFQVAPEDQCLKVGFWKGGEAITVQNMHDKHAVLNANVPHLRVRIFGASQNVKGEFVAGEAKTRLETVFLVPDFLTGIALFRAVIEVDDPEGSDIVGLCAEIEQIDQPAKPTDYYIDSFINKLKNELGDVVPKLMPNLVSKQEEEKELDKMLAELEHQRQNFVAQMSELGMPESQIISKLKGNPQTRALALAIEHTTGGIGGFFNEMKDFAQSVQNVEKVSKKGGPPKVDFVASRLARKEVLARQAASESCRELILPNADLSGLDLSGLDFSGSVLMGASFIGSVAVGTKFDRATLTEANFVGADLSKASFVLSGLSQAKFQGVNLLGANLAGSDCSQANFTDAMLENVDLSATSFLGAQLRNANLVNASAHKADFTGSILVQSNFMGANLIQANFSATDLSEANLSKTRCINASFSCSKMHKAKFAGADLSDSSADKGTQATAVDFRDAHLDKVSWVGANLCGSNFDRITGNSADFSAAVMTEVTMRRAEAKGIIFDKASIEKSDFSMSNFMESSFARTKLSNVDLLSCNLYGANFLETDFVNVRIDGSYIARTVLAEKIGKIEV